MNEAEILAYQREQFVASGMSPEEVDRVFGTGAWEYEKRVAAEETGDPWPFVPQAEAEAFLPAVYAAPPAAAPPVLPPTLPPIPLVLPITQLGGTSMTYNGYAPLPGSSPPSSLLVQSTANDGVTVPQGDNIALLGILSAAIRSGGTILLGFIRTLIARVGWGTIVTILGTALAAKILAMLNDGDPDDKKVLLGKRKHKRYSIGRNPRLRTLLKVANRVDGIFDQYDKGITRFRTRVKGPKARTRTIYVDRPQKDLTIVR